MADRLPTPPTPRDDYYVLMWNFMEPMFSSGAGKADLAIARFRELGCNGATLIASYVDHAGYRELYRRIGLGEFEHTKPATADYRYRENNLPFYVMNLCPAVYMKWEKGKPLFRAQYDAFARDGDRHVFVRTPCINNPDVRSACIGRVERVVTELAPMRDNEGSLALLYDWRDELTVTAFILAADTCFCEHCMAAMRVWLKEVYGDLAALNAQWGTTFAAWDQVEPITTLEALARRDNGDWNFSPWADHRDFMNHTLAGFLAELKAEIRRHDPAARSGPTGTQCPSVFGGYDFSRLVPISDWVEAYDFGQSADLWRSFKPRRDFPIFKTDFARGPAPVTEAMLWTYVFQSGGYGGTIIWESNMMLDVESPDLAPTDHARAHAHVYAELRSGLPRLLQLCDEVNSPVAVHHSHASVNADFITAVPNRVKSVAAWEPERYLAFHCRNAWWKLLEDRGLRPVFIDSRQIAAGELVAREGSRGVKLLVMPRSIAVSDAEAAQIAKFVEAGGVVVADSFAGRMDEHCRERPVGALDGLFGVRRTSIDNYHSSNQRASLGWDAVRGDPPKWGKGEARAECSAIEECIEAAPAPAGSFPTDSADFAEVHSSKKSVESVESAGKSAGETIVMGCSEYSDSPIGFRAVRGKGQAILFNAAPLDYVHARRAAGAAGGANFHDFFGRAVELAGVEPLAQVLDAATGRRLAGWRVWAFEEPEFANNSFRAASGSSRVGTARELPLAARARYFGVAPDLAVSQDILGAITGAAAVSGQTGRAVRIRLSAEGQLYEARSGRYLGAGRELEDRLDATSARLYAVLPYRVEGMELSVSGGVVRAAIRCGTDSQPVQPGLHVFRFDVTDADGKRLLDRGANVVADAGRAEWRPESATPAVPPGARITCRDVATGVSATIAAG